MSSLERSATGQRARRTRVAVRLVAPTLLAAASVAGQSSAPAPKPTIDPSDPFGIENPTTEQVVGKLRDRDWRVRYYAGYWLASRSGRAQQAVPALVRALKDSWEPVRKVAALALGVAGAGGAEAVPALVELLDGTTGDRRAAAQALGRIGPTQEACAALIRAARRDDHGSGASEAAVRALASSDDLERFAAQLVEFLGRPRVGFAASEVLVGLGPAAAGAVEGLIEATHHPEAGGRSAAARVLGSIGPEAGPAIPALFGLLEDTDSSVRDAAAAAIVAIREGGDGRSP